MLALQTAVHKQSYAQQVNAQYYAQDSNIISLFQRFTETINAMPSGHVVTTMLQQAAKEFMRLYSHVKNWGDMHLAQAIYVPLSDIYIDTTMQRQLDLYWVSKLLAKFKSTKVVPIQVYLDPESKRYCAWDGQHTAILLWFIATQILKLDPTKVLIPVNVYHSSKKSEMRECFLDLNSGEGKKGLEAIDHWMQHVCAVRIDGSKNPYWVLTEQKQSILEKYDLFVTHEKFYNDHLPGAISRLQEINKLDLVAVEWLAEYLSYVVEAQARPAGEKEMVMMGHYFYRCRVENLPIDSNYIRQLADTTLLLWNSDFSPRGPFWNKVIVAYENWHRVGAWDPSTDPRVKKEPVHGFPFLVAQLQQSLSGLPVPRNDSNSNFWPAAGDLF